MPYPKRDSSYAFIYDGTLEGLLCAIFETYRQKLVPSEIVTEENLQLRLGQQPITIPTSPAIAQRVKDGLCRDCGRTLSAPLEWRSFPMSPIKVQQFVLSCATP